MGNNYKKEALFSTHIFQFVNNDLALKLKDFILNLDEISGIESKVSPNIKNNLVESEFNLLQRDDETIIATKTYFAQCIKEALNDLYNGSFDYKISFNDSWYHISKKNSSHDAHNHRNCSWCGIFYLQSGDLNNKGETKFLSPIDSNYADAGTIHSNEDSATITPEDGKLILFPSYLEHYQALYTGDKDRIVVAFNSSIIERH